MLDFRELSEAVECHTGEKVIYVCDDVLMMCVMMWVMMCVMMF